MGLFNFHRLFGIRRENPVGEEEIVYRDEFEWDYEEVPFFGDSFPIFPADADQHGNDGDVSYQEATAGMQNASEPDNDPSSVFVPWQGDVEAPKRSVFTCQRGWKLSIKCRLWMTSVMLLTALVAFPVMLLLPMGAGQGAWPLSDNVTCHDYTPQFERYLHICKTVARVAILPMATGLLGALVLNVFQLFAWRQERRLMSAIFCYISALIYVVYIAVLPYQCASSSPTAALSFSCTFFQFLALLLVPCLQEKEDTEEEDSRKEKVIRKTEEDEALGESTLLLDPSAVVRSYYHLTPPPHTIVFD